MGENTLYKTGIKNIIFTIVAQSISFLLSIISGFILPNEMGVIQYGYWQVYLLYVSFILFFSFGFNDGLYLRYGKYDYSSLPFEKLRTAIRIYIIFILIITFGLLALSNLESDSNKTQAFWGVSINLLILGINGTVITILQFTNRIKLYSILTIANKVIFVISIILLIVVHKTNFRFIIAADICTKIFILGIIIYITSELFIGKTSKFIIGLKEFWINIVVGINLMLANIISSLLIGVGRFLVERFMPIETYSLYSFASTITFFALALISASSLSLYPLLKRLRNENLPSFYINLNKIFSLIIFILLACYFPLYFLIKFRFETFSGVLAYLYLLFVMIVTEGKMQFLVNTYFKVLREEKAMLFINIIGVVITLLLVIPAFFITNSIFAIIIGTTLSLLLRCYISELYLKRKMGINNFTNIFIELLMLAIFVISTAWGVSTISIIIYLISVITYAYLNRFSISNYFTKVFYLFKGN